MSEQSPWAPRPGIGRGPGDGPGGPSPEDPSQEDQSPAGPSEEDRGAWSDPATMLGLAVALLAAAGICALLGQHFLLGALRLAAGILAGLGAGAALLALLGSRLRPRPRALLAGGTAVVLMLALTVPAVLATRSDPLSEQSVVVLEALADGDAVHSLPEPASPVLVRRADGGAQLLDRTGVRSLDAHPDDALALSADGTRLIRATGASTEVLLLDATVTTPDGGPPTRTFDGTPLALAGDLLVLRHCTEGTCRLIGYDLTAPAEPLWTTLDAEETRGVDPLGVQIPARSATPPDQLAAVRATGVLPTVPLRFDPVQGWVQLDPATGFPVGRILAGPEQECRIAATGRSPRRQDPLQESALVLTVCSAADGALTATAHQDGEVLWESEASPAGEWSVRMDQGRVLATGTETGTDTAGEMLASEQQAAWTAPGGDGIDHAAAFTSRIGIDGGTMLVTNAGGQLVAYDAATGTNTWTLPLTSLDATVRGSLTAGTAVVLDPLVRESPLDPRGAQRLRVIDAASGEITAEAVVGDDIDAVHPLGGGRALVTVDGKSLLLGP